MTRKETLKNKIVMIGSGKSAPFYLLTEKCTISYEEVEFEEAIGKGHTAAGDVKIVISNHDSKILVGAKIVDYDGAITINAIVSTPVLTLDRSSWCVRIVNLSAAEITVKGKLIFTYLG